MTETEIAQPTLELVVLDKDDPTVLTWWTIHATNRNGHFTHLRPGEVGQWRGLRVGARLLAAIGVTICTDGTLFVEEFLCEPSRGGVAARAILAAVTKKSWSGPIRFNCELRNRAIRRLVERLGSRPVAALYEVAGGMA